ncbi:MAG: hypothetical protein ACFE9D_00325 [Promethearchaeota archaeon]
MFTRFGWFRLIVAFSLVILILSFLGPTPISAALVWNEDFEISNIEELDDWVLQGYELIANHYYEIDHGFTIENGALTAENVNVPWAIYLSQPRRALHNSNVVYGTWSFDWTVSKSQDTYDSVEIMFTDLEGDYNLTGPFTGYHMTGYTLILDTVQNNEMYIEKLNGNEGIKLARYNFTTRPSGLHHIDISRDLTGQFHVYFDSQLVLQVADNEITSSEKFNFVSFQGNSSIDNIVVSNSVDIIPPSMASTIIFVVVLGLVILCIIIVIIRTGLISKIKRP